MAYHLSKTLGGGYIDGVNCMAFSPDGTFLASGQSTGIMIWCVHTGVALHSIKTRVPILSVTWTVQYDQSVIISGCRDGQILSIMLEKDSLIAMGFPAHERPVERLTSVVKDSSKRRATLFASGGCDEAIVWGLTWTKRTLHPTWKRIKPLPRPKPIAFNFNDRVVLTGLQWCGRPKEADTLLTSYLNHGVILYKVEALETDTIISSLITISASLSPDGRFVTASNLFTGFMVFRASNGELLHNLLQTGTPADNLDRPVPVAYLKSGKHFVGGSCTGRLTIWDVVSGDEVQTLVHEGLIQALATHDDPKNGSLFATGATRVTAGTGPAIILWKETKSEELPANVILKRKWFSKAYLYPLTLRILKNIIFAILVMLVGSVSLILWSNYVYRWLENLLVLR